MKYLALIGGAVASLGTFLGWWTYTSDAHFATRINMAALVLLGLLVLSVLFVLFVRYGLPAFWASADAWSRLQDARVDRQVKLTHLSRYAPSSTGMYELPASAVEAGAFHRAMELAVVHSQYEEPRVALGAPPALLPESADAPELPGPIDLAALDFVPSKNRILLGQLPGGDLATASIQQLCHVALCGATGGGKSNLMRLILPQLQAIGASVVLADPHYTSLDIESGDDWRAIEQRLMLAPAVKAGQIGDLFAYLLEELERRLERRNRQERIGAPLFVAFDELPVIIEEVKGAADALGKLLREGRKVHMLTVGASQDFLVKTIGSQSGVRDCYRTAFYVGGDLHSASALLDMPRRDIDDGPLGGGIAMLRSASTTPAQLIRVPLASNAGIAGLLGDSAATMPDVRDFRNGFKPTSADATPKAESRHFEVTPEVTSAASERRPSVVLPDDPETARILAFMRAGTPIPEIVRAIAGSTSGAKATAAHQQISALLKTMLGEVP